MDYSKVKFVTPSVGCKYFTKGKVYRFNSSGGDAVGGFTYDDFGDRVYIRIPGCAHISDNNWIPCYEDGTPLTKELTPLEAEMLAMLETINEGINTMDFTQLEGLQSEIEDLIKKAK